jgi:hypothetical protein
MKKNFLLLCILFFCAIASAQKPSPQTAWWKQNNLRVIQVNLPDYEAATLDPELLVKDLVNNSANTLIINGGGIMAFYPTKLALQYTNPYLKNNNMLADVVKKCHQHNIRVIFRFDFSRVHESIFKSHPDWCYISPKGERIINTDMYAVSINGPYVQDGAFKIISEAMDTFPIDGIFLNMPGYQVNNAYEGKYLGIDQNDYDKKRFLEYSKGTPLPLEENKNDPAFQKYVEFKKFTGDDWSKRLYELVKAKNPQAAICTYTDEYVDIIRHESQANSALPYWPYAASDNVGNAMGTFPSHIISNASIQQISFQSRYNAVEPQEVAIRLYENIANGSGLDLSMMGDMQNYEDERNYGVIKEIYGFHKKYEPYFGNYKSLAKVALIAPGTWPSGLPMNEYRGIMLMLKEAHIPFDIITDNQVQNLPEKIKAYKVVILPDINNLNTNAVQLLKDAVNNGTNLIATNTALSDYPDAQLNIFGAKIINKDNDGAGNYLAPDNYSVFKRLTKQKMIFLKYNLGQYDLSAADERYLPLLAKGRPGPPEIIGGHDRTGSFAMAVKKNGKGTAVLMPFNIGRLYYLNGYEEHKDLFLDVLDKIYPQAAQTIVTDAPARIEVILQQYGKNTTAANKTQNDGLIMHLINITGFSGATYFKPLTVYNLHFKVQSRFKPSKVLSMTTLQPIPFTWKDGAVSFTVKDLDAFKSVLINK